MNTKNKVLLSSLISMAVLSLTACGGGDSTPEAQHPDPDFFSPNISLNGGDVVIEEGTTYIDAGATASDNVDGDNVNVVTSGFVDADTAGTYSMTYSATDAAGNEAEATRTIKVIRGTEFNTYDGRWEISCQPADPANTELADKGITYMNQIMTIGERDITLRARGFNNSTCEGRPVYKGTAEGRVIYTGKIISGSFTGENIDVTLIKAHFSGADSRIIELEGTDNLAIFADTMGLPKYDILSKASSDVLVNGKRTSANDGSSFEKRPTEFNASDPFFKTN